MRKSILPLIIIATIFISSMTAAYAFSSMLTEFTNPTTGQYANYSFIFPENGSVFPNITTLWTMQYNLTLNTTVLNCSLMIDNNQTYFYMINSSANNKTWSNSSAWNYAPMDNAFHNFRFKCYNVTGGTVSNNTNITYTNSSLYQFKVTSSTININYAGGPVNGTYYTNATLPMLNISVVAGPSPASCYYILNATAGAQTPVSLKNTTSMNYSNSQTIFYTNTSAFLSPNITTFGEIPQNLTAYCTNAFGNKTWLNSSASNSSGFIHFWIGKSIMPQVEEVYNPTNATTGGNKIQVNWTIMDNVPLASCGLHGYADDGTVANFTTATFVTGGTRQNCTAYINPADVIKSGKYIIELYSTDIAGNTGNSSTNKTMVLTKLSTGWNLVSTPYNYTLGMIGGLAPNISYVSAYNNTIGWKNYTTYTAGSSTNYYSVMNMTNATYVYATVPIVLMMNYSTLPQSWSNSTLWGNTSTGSGWNYIGMPAYVAAINDTMWNTRCNNISSTVQPGTNCDNVTVASVYVHSLGKYCSAFRNVLSTSCYPTYTSLNLSIPYGQGLWLWTSNNITYNRTIG